KKGEPEGSPFCIAFRRPMVFLVRPASRLQPEPTRTYCFDSRRQPAGRIKRIRLPPLCRLVVVMSETSILLLFERFVVVLVGALGLCPRPPAIRPKSMISLPFPVPVVGACAHV